MDQHHVAIGLLAFLAAGGWLAMAYLRAPKRSPLPRWGWVGLAILATGQSLLPLRLRLLSTFFTPIMWTGYVLLADGMVRSLRGESRLGAAPREFASLAFWSVPLWLIFEAYNLRLENWTYVGLPLSALASALGYIWSFATIWPAIFETADLIDALRPHARGRPRAVSRVTLVSLAAAGFLCLTLPVAVPVAIGRYLFAPVWLGFALLLEPVNYVWGGRSLLREAEQGDTSALRSFLLAGLVCGIFWEFWNYWAAAKWIYVFPIGQSWKVFEMPLPGFLGFPPFAVECLVMYEFLRTLKKKALARPCEPAPVMSSPPS
jgi:hypothetical protein